MKSFNVQIWCGLKVQYTDKLHSIKDVERICDEYVNEIGDCVTITETNYRYVDGYEPGVVIGYIQYPRFPRTRKEIKRRSIELAKILKLELGQYRVTITTPKESIML